METATASEKKLFHKVLKRNHQVMMIPFLVNMIGLQQNYFKADNSQGCQNTGLIPISEVTSRASVTRLIKTVRPTARIF